MSAEPQPHLRLVNPETGEIEPEAPSYAEALKALTKLQVQLEMMNRDLAGKRLRIAQLEADREAQAEADPLAAEVELIHALWKRACKRRRPLHFTDREQIAAAIKKLGLRKCLRAVAGAAYDPNYSKPRRNGFRERYDDLDLVFRSYSKVLAFAARAPKGWEPDIEKVAEIGGVSVEWAQARITEGKDTRRSYAGS